MADVNPETCGIDEQVDRPILGRHADGDVTELPQSPGECRVIGDREAGAKESDKGPEEARNLGTYLHHLQNPQSPCRIRIPPTPLIGRNLP